MLFGAARPLRHRLRWRRMEKGFGAGTLGRAAWPPGV